MTGGRRVVWTHGTSGFATRQRLPMGRIALAVAAARDVTTVPDDRNRPVACVRVGDLTVWFFQDGDARTICSIDGVPRHCRRDKRRFSTAAMAARFRDGRRGFDDYDPTLEPYYCDGINPDTGRTCGFWHLGHASNAIRSNRFVRGEERA